MTKTTHLSALANRIPGLKVRHAVLFAIRSWFESYGFLEVETPLLLPTVAPEAHIEPIRCEAGYLATSPEIQMKELLAAGMDRIFQITRSFRSGESGRLHSPEFTILEWYRSGNKIQDLVDDLQGLLTHTALQLTGGLVVSWQGRTINFAAPWRVTSVQDAFMKHAGWDPVAGYDAERFNKDLVLKVEPALGHGSPELLAFYPIEAASLSKPLPEDPRVGQRVELYVEGIELANGFVELDDPEEQRRRFEKASLDIRSAGRIPPPMPEEFLSSLRWLPECVGMAVGVDRMVMLFAGASRLDEIRVS